MTVTDSPVPVVAEPETVMVAEIVVELTTLTFENVTPLGAFSLAPIANPVPVNMTRVVLPRATLDGLSDESEGAGITDKKTPVALEWSGLVTATSQLNPGGVVVGT